ncbi:MAG: DUF1850 domain-containing protein [Deltaproteobacteria bacterium]|jgi:hypothetical protein|nr:DUF1850 domain-containing protein [Deltaproteobacteria bacterium]
MPFTGRGRTNTPGNLLVLALFLALLALSACVPLDGRTPGDTLVLRISDWKTGAQYAEVPVRAGSRLFFGWVHSLEHIPWNEYYHVGAGYSLILDAITFTAFGAGIPENKGKICYVRDGLIHMEEIDQVFTELVWLNSHTATKDIILDNILVARGDTLPEHTRMRLVVEER